MTGARKQPEPGPRSGPGAEAGRETGSGSVPTPRRRARKGAGAELSAASRIGLAAAAGLFFAALLFLGGASERMDAFFFDINARAGAALDKKTAIAPESRVELVYIDQYSLGWVEEKLGLAWPWPRELYGVMASFLAQAKVQAFDILFSEASSFGAEDDARCAAAMDAAGNVVAAEAVDAHSGARLSALPTKKTDYGRVSALIDRDGVLRRYRTGGGALFSPSAPLDSASSPPGLAAPSLGAAVVAKGGELAVSRLPTEVYLRFAGSSPSFPARNAAEIIASAMNLRAGGQPQLNPERYAGKYVFIGFSAPGLFDLRAVPTDRAMPGAEIHATFVDNALQGQWLEPLPPFAEAALVVFYAFFAAFLANRAKRLLPLAAGASLFVLIPPAAAFVLYRAGLVASAGLELSSGVLAYAAGVLVAYVSEGKNKAFLRRSFSQYLSPAVIDALLKNPTLLELGGEEKNISLFFSDIQGFTALSEAMDPRRLAAFMNLYLSVVTEEILAEGGTLDKYVGDAVVAFWNAPLDQDDHGARAVRAALRCQKALEAARGRFAALGAAPPLTRIGIHTGPAIVGNMGSPSRFNYTALGDTVNMASRLEGANKMTGTRVLVSKAVVEACLGQGVSAGLEFRRLGEIVVSGRKAAIEVWEPRFLGESPGGAPAWQGLKECKDA